MRNIRLLKRLLLLTAWFAVMELWALPGLFMGRRGIYRNAKIARFWAAGCARIIGLKLRVEGDPSSFTSGMVVSNHLGYLDVLSTGAVFPIRFAPKAEIARWPILGALVALSRPIWIDRKNRTKAVETEAEYRRTLEEGGMLLVFPEGTSTDGENGLLPFKSTPFEAILEAGRAFLPILLEYELPEDGQTVAWYGEMEMWPHLRHLLGQPEIRARVKILPPMEPQPGETRKQLAVRTHEVMDREYRRMHG